jgi:hypothetical protein
MALSTATKCSGEGLFRNSESLLAVRATSGLVMVVAYNSEQLFADKGVPFEVRLCLDFE